MATSRVFRNGSSMDEPKYRYSLNKAMPAVIETEDEYERLLPAIEAIMDKDDDITAEEGRLLKLLAMLVEDYEDRKITLPRSKPHKMLAHLLKERELKPSALWPVVGSRSRVSEILSGKRSISKEETKKLAAFFRVPVDLFV